MSRQPEPRTLTYVGGLRVGLLGSDSSDSALFASGGDESDRSPEGVFAAGLATCESGEA